MKYIILVIIALLPIRIFAAPTPNVTVEQDIVPPDGYYKKIAKLAIVDKRTAIRDVLEMSVGSTLTYESIELSLSRCWIENSPVVPEHAALIEIQQPENPAAERLLFSGWLFKHMSELSHLEHQKYDVLLLECFDGDAEAQPDNADE